MTMDTLIVSLIVLACIFICALLGFFARNALPDHHLKDDTLLSVSLTTGLAATISSLVLGLMISATYASFNRMCDEVAMTAATTIILDRTLAEYGSETGSSRQLLIESHLSSIHFLYQARDRIEKGIEGPVRRTHLEKLLVKLRQLDPKDDNHRAIKAYAVEQAQRLLETRWLLVEHRSSTIPQPFFIALVAWLSFIFFGFGLLTANNSTVLISLFGGALIAASAIFVIIELENPLGGIISVPSAPMETALTLLGQPI